MIFDPMFLRNFFVLMSSFSPVIALFLPPVKELNNWKAVLIVESVIFGAFLSVLFFLPYVHSKTMPAVLSLYPLFLFLFNLVLLLKFKVAHFSKILSVSVILSFVTTELHELPAFTYSYLALEFLDPGKWIFFLSPIATLIFFILATKIFSLSLSARSKLLLLLSVAGLYVFYLLNPQIDINGIPSVLAYLKRFYCFVILAAAFLIGGDPQHE